jgi:HAD superfamily hydrolase (TIGR01549 family)
MRIYRPDAFERPPDAVLFDTDNTLYDYEPAHRAAMQAASAKAVGLFGITEADFDQAFETARLDTKARLGRTASSHSRLLYFQRMLEILGLGSQVLLALDLEQTYWRTLLSHAKLFDGVKSMLDDLRIARVPRAIVTDLTAQIQFRKVIYFGLDHYFDYIVTSEEVGFDKPHPAPFERAIAKMNAAGKHVWMIGDDPIADIAGARQALSAVTLQKIHGRSIIGEGDHRPDAAFETFEELRALYAQLTSGSLEVR